MKIGYIGFGKMGLNMILRLQEKGHDVVGYNRSEDGRQKGREAGVKTVKNSIKEMVADLPAPRTMWIMVSHSGVDEVLAELLPLLEEGDTIIEGGNTYYKDTMRRAAEIESKGINFVDVGVSGGPGGARNGACVMVGGKKEDFDRLEKLFADIAAETQSGSAYKYFGSHGAGHFVKMVHNGIEYGMMQSIAEGFNIMKNSSFNLDLSDVADLYQKRSVVESRLVGWLSQGFEKFGENLDGISGEVSASGEGEWTVKTAKEMSLPVAAIDDALQFRIRSKGNPTFLGKVLSTMRTMFGGHDVAEKK